MGTWLAGGVAAALLLTPAAAQAGSGSADGPEQTWTGTILVAPSEEQGAPDTVVLQTPEETLELVGDIPSVASGQAYQVTGESVDTPEQPDVEVSSVEPVDPGAASAAMAASAAPGNRAVVVVGVDVPGGTFQGSYGAPQAQAAVNESDAYFSRSTGGAFRFTYAGFVGWENTPQDLTPVGIENVTGFTASNRCNIAVVHTVAVYMAGLAGYDISTTTVAAVTDNDICGPVGQGWINYPGIAMYGYASSDSFAHELGHNLGLGHSGIGYCLSNGANAGPVSHCTSFGGASRPEDYVYGDYGALGDIMGYGSNAAATQVGDLGPVHLEALGLLSDSNTTAIPYEAPGIGMDAFVTQAYKDVLRRTPAPDDAGVRGWSDALQSGNRTRNSFADAIVYSTESTMNHAGDLYREILEREPDLRGQQGWAGEIAAKRLSLKDARAVYWGSYERFLRSGFSHREWVTDLYQMELRRDPEPTGLNGWVAALDSGARTRTQVAQAFVDCPECATKAVTRAYQEYLGRDPDPAGLAGWVSIYPWSDYLVLTVYFVASDEYYNNAARAVLGGAQPVAVEQLLGGNAGVPNDLRLRSPDSETHVALRNGRLGVWVESYNSTYRYADSVRYPDYLSAGSNYTGNLGVKLYIDSVSGTGANLRYQRQ